jgi:hypothetical protein
MSTSFHEDAASWSRSDVADRRSETPRSVCAFGHERRGGASISRPGDVTSRRVA